MKYPWPIEIEGKVTVLYSMEDFTGLVEKYMGTDARRFLRDLIEENEALWEENRKLIDELCMEV